MAEIKKSGEQFGSRLGLIAAMLGMAVGTGNIWRFPREVASNNGGAFILMCFLALFIWAVPLICAESVFGKKSRMANAGGFKTMLGEKYTWMGTFTALTNAFLGAYYVVVVGWCLKYLVIILTGFLSTVREGGVEVTTQYFNNFALTPPSYESWVWFIVGIAICSIAVFRGIQGGIETANKVMIPMVFILLAFLFVRVLFIPGAMKGLEFMYHVDVKDFGNPRIWLAAFTQAAWSTGAGWGMFHIYYIYSAKDEDIELNAFTATFGDMVAAMLAGMVVLPTVFALAPNPEAVKEVLGSGANGLTFIHLTNLFAHTSGGFVMGALFFLALLSAAVSSVIAMIETGTRNLIDMGFPRAKATLCTALFFAVVGSYSALDNRFFNNQDMVWGVALLMVGLLYSIGSMKYGVEKLWNEDISPCSDIQVKWMWSVIKFFPFEFAFVWGWWMWDAKSWYPGEWFKFWPPTQYQYTPGVMVVEWALVFAVCLLLNGFLSKRLIYSNKID